MAMVERAGPHTIRIATAADAAVIADLIRCAFAAQPRPTSPPSSALKETGATVAAHLARGGGAVLERGGIVVGAVLWEVEDESLYISRVSVDPVYRRQGIARALVEEAEREARRSGLLRMTLGVRLELEENRQLFRSCGFEDFEFRRHEGYTEPTWVLMERRLS
ncbi:MAG TPA: GNAT family N-acetyltransferase [Methylomirabilota bacterium]|nr:GNAT family N-acetyltransferase [Methylomirabilota bacterium]